MSIAFLSAQKKNEIKETLAEFGLNEKAQNVYTALLSLGQTTITPISRATRLRLTTAQSIITRLVELGLVRVTKHRSRHVYETLDPIILRRILERRIEEVAGIIPFLQKLKTESGTAPKIQVYFRERMTDIFHQALGAKNKMIYEIVAAKDLQEILGEKFHFTRRRIKNDIHLQSLRIESREIKKYSSATHARELREAKFLPRELTFRCSLMFWDDTIAFFTTNEEGLAWTVQNASLRETFQQIFTLLWSVSRKMETV